MKRWKVVLCSIWMIFLWGVAEAAVESVSPTEAFEIGNQHLQKEEFKEAAEAYTQVLRATPKDGRASALRGYSYMQIGLYEQAIADFDEAISTGIETVYVFRGLSHYQLKHYEHSIRDFDLAERQGSTDMERIYYFRGLSYFELKKIDEAIREAQAMVAMFPKNSGGYHLLGIFYRNSGDLDQGEKILKKGLKLFPENANLHYTLGNIYQDQGNITGSKKTFLLGAKHFHTAWTLDPSSSNARANLGACYAKGGEYQQAIDTLEGLKPNTAMLIIMAKCYEGLGDKAKMKETYRRAIALEETAGKTTELSQIMRDIVDEKEGAKGISIIGMP